MAKIRVMPGDCIASMKRLAADGELVDAVVCDPPYHLTSIVKRFGSENAAPAKHGTDGAYARASAGFMGQKWDGGDIAFRVETWKAAYECLKPGGYLLAFSGTRTYHRMACAIEDAGFEIRDSILDIVASDTHVTAFLETLSQEQVEAFFRCIDESQFGGMLSWVYGTGFPKSHDVAKAIDKAAGQRGEYGEFKSDRAEATARAGRRVNGVAVHDRPWMDDPEVVANMQREYIPATDAAREWSGWGTALKPAWEPIVVARKPLDGTVAANVLAHGTGAMNIDACRIGEREARELNRHAPGGVGNSGHKGGQSVIDGGKGRFPANVIHDGSEEVIAAFPAEAGASAPVRGSEASAPTNNAYGEYGRVPGAFHNDSGSAARFFYSAKASRAERRGSKHPTVKPVALMAYLVRLVTRRGGTVLDPFAGTGTTGEAAYIEGVNAILCEQSPEYLEDIKRRLSIVTGHGPHSANVRAFSRPASGEISANEHGPLFAAANGEGGE